MKIVKQYPDGIFNWLDLSTSDIRGAEAFYTQLFGWQADTEAIGDSSMNYTTFSLGGYTVSGGGEMADEMKGAMPSSWASMIKHSDIDGVVARAAEAGAVVVMPPMDVEEQGRMALMQDPTGAVFGVWQPNRHIGAQLVNQPNTLVWTELHTRDREAATAFYNNIFGWKDRAGESGYVMWSDDNGRVHAGLHALNGAAGDAPSQWLAYFLVDDVDATAARAVELGGTVSAGPSGDEGMRWASLLDPQGALFGIINYGSAADDPPGEVEELPADR